MVSLHTSAATEHDSQNKTVRAKRTSAFHLSPIYRRFIIQWHLGGAWRSLLWLCGQASWSVGEWGGGHEGHVGRGEGSQSRHQIKWVADLTFQSSRVPAMEEGWTGRIILKMKSCRRVIYYLTIQEDIFCFHCNFKIIPGLSNVKWYCKNSCCALRRETPHVRWHKLLILILRAESFLRIQSLSTHFSSIMTCEVSVSCPQDPVTGPYSKRDQSSPHFKIRFMLRSISKSYSLLF